jgi:hypothetical protein
MKKTSVWDPRLAVLLAVAGSPPRFVKNEDGPHLEAALEDEEDELRCAAALLEHLADHPEDADNLIESIAELMHREGQSDECR